MKVLEELKGLETLKKLEDCNVPAIGQMNGCRTTAYLADPSSELGISDTERIKEFDNNENER